MRPTRYRKNLGVPPTHQDDRRRWYLAESALENGRALQLVAPWRNPPAYEAKRDPPQPGMVKQVVSQVEKLSVKDREANEAEDKILTSQRASVLDKEGQEREEKGGDNSGTGAITHVATDSKTADNTTLPHDPAKTNTNTEFAVSAGSVDNNTNTPLAPGTWKRRAREEGEDDKGNTEKTSNIKLTVLMGKRKVEREKKDAIKKKKGQGDNLSASQKEDPGPEEEQVATSPGAAGQLTGANDGSNGQWTDDPKDINKMATDFFNKLYTKDSQVVLDELINLLHQPITNEMNEKLCREFSDEEVGDALFQIGPINAPGPDGLPGRFFQRNWAIMKQDVIEAVREFFKTGEMAEGANDTVIVLIPKGQNQECLADYRPISLCNVIYKIISKCLVNRLRPLLDNVISETQSAFIPGRLITDNAIIAFEGFHKIQKHKHANNTHCAYKIDLSKAYDRVDWDFLEKAMLKMGFCKTWTSWIMSCVKSVRFAVRVNGSTLPPFTPSRGLRQGDPLSPYLFLLIGEALTCILKHEVIRGSITPLKVARRASGISNLLFADDCLLFFKAIKEEAHAVKSALNLFQRCIGQLVSVNKCSVLFSQACPTAVQEEIKSTLGVTSFTFEEKYLGLPTPEGRVKSDQFQPIMVRFTKRLTNWAERFMSHGVKDTLIKSVAQALPRYVMGIFKMSTGFCEQFERLIRDFWWGDDQNSRKVHWMAWENMIKPKCKGGIGFRDMACFNQALLARQAWRLIQRPDNLCARVLKAKYYPNGNILDTVFASDASPAWKGVEFGLQLLKEGTIKRIGNGRDTQFARDNWLPRDSGLKLAGLKKNSRRRWVNQLFLQDSNSWNANLLRELFHDFDVQTILKIRLPEHEVKDCVAWHYEPNGIFSVKSAYKLAINLKHKGTGVESSSNQNNGERKIWDTIWKTNVPPKVKVFGWRVATNSLATWDNKYRRTLETNNTCPICANGVEDAFHASVACTKARALRDVMRKEWKLPDDV
ncbi:hypothetical protein QYE76_022033 [Lolium multiflorum]|uniref:Reverse transcriptase domain-containing protein n=1 Tax=Lolium multiflorum TaxID=4521 RepID=A0AAD8R906_LOLMU|nr:hypothetical protein QYE76_022033 [Lolium multiflorum]